MEELQNQLALDDALFKKSPKPIVKTGLTELRNESWNAALSVVGKRIAGSVDSQARVGNVTGRAGGVFRVGDISGVMGMPSGNRVGKGHSGCYLADGVGFR
jgi:hypothetical protein